VLHRGQQAPHSDEDCRKLAAGFSQFFTDKIQRIRQSIAASLQQSTLLAFDSPPHDGLQLTELTPVTADEVRKVLTSTRIKSSPLDVLPASLLRSSVNVFAPILAHMANLSFAERCFPTAFKTAQVLPLLKKAGLDRDDMSSYRPISNLTTASKVIERLFLNRLRPQLLGSRNFSRLQSAYRRGHSTETALLHVLNGVYAAADQKRVTALVGLDMSAAFDTIDHDVLLERLDHRFGVRDAASSWLRSYLTNRQQFVKLGRHSSVVMPCDSGVPQGSVLGPLLFTAYTAPVSDLIESFGVCCHQFADDTQLFIAMNVAGTSSRPSHTLLCCG